MKKTCLLLIATILPGMLPGEPALPVLPRETDPESQRKSHLGEQSHESILRTDLDKDRDPDLFERWWHGKRIRWIDENDDAAAHEVMPDGLGDALQIDVDGDGYYDGPADLTLKWWDKDGDGIPDIEIYQENPGPAQTKAFTGSSHFFVSINPDQSGRFSGIDWRKLRTDFAGYQNKVNWRPNYHGNAIFLKEHMPVWAIEDPRKNWENPFLFWDPDGDGCSELAMRVTDTRRFVGPGQNRVAFDGIADEVWISYDIDNDASRDNEKDHDLTLYFGGGAGIDYRGDVHRFPGLAAPDWALPYYRHPEWRKLDHLFFLPHEQAMERALSTRWGKAYLTFDEDDDCHRWERVELLYPGDPYVLEHGNPASVVRHNQADTLGDRGEWDEDFSGGGNLYLAAWSGGIHLLGAERGVWLVDKDRRYWGAAHPNELVSRKKAEKPEEVIGFEDRDGNGFFDFITHDFDGDGHVDLAVDFKALGLKDHGTKLSPRALGWEGLRDAYAAHVKSGWNHTMRLHREAMRHGFADADSAELTLATATSEKRRNAFLIRMAVLRKVLEKAEPAEHPKILRAWFGADPLAPGAVMAEVAAAGAAKQAALPHFVPKGIVLDYEGLRYRPHDDIIFPSVIATTGRIEKPLGKYYLYYAPHDPPGGICLAYADDLAGPWKEYDKNPVIARKWPPHHDVSHVSGPHALWHEKEGCLFLYYHGENPVTRLATSEDGLRFRAEGVVLSTADAPGLSEASYARVFAHPIEGEDTQYVMLFMGNDRGTRRIYQARSADARAWRVIAEPFLDPPPGTDQVAGAWWFPWRGRHLVLCHANASTEGPPGNIHNRDFHLYLAETDAGFRPARHLGRFMDASRFGDDNPGLMCPSVFEEDGKLHMFLNTGARLNNRISRAVSEDP